MKPASGMVSGSACHRFSETVPVKEKEDKQSVKVKLVLTMILHN